MDEREIIFGDAHLKHADKSAGLPEGVRLLCGYSLMVQPFDVEEAAFLRRTAATDELWLVSAVRLSALPDVAAGKAAPGELLQADILQCGCAFIVVRKGDELAAGLKLLDLLFRAQYGFESPQGIVAEGIVGQEAFDGVVGAIRAEARRNREAAQAAESAIVRVAREVGLNPRPSGESPGSWAANCPERNHPIWLDAEKDTFGCPWCRRGGSTAELRAWVEERKAAQKAAPPAG